MYETNDRSNFILNVIGEGKKNISNIVDLGCNDGATLCGLKKSGRFLIGSKFHGVDYSDIAASNNEIIFSHADLNGDLSEISSVLKSADLILLLDVLEHLLSPEEFLRVLSEQLESDAELVISVPNAASVRLLLAWLRGEFPREDIGFFDRTHRSWFSKKVLCGLTLPYFKILDQGYIFSNYPLIRFFQRIYPSRLTSQFYLRISVE